MTSSDNDLTLHLPLDEIEDNSVLDETENDNDGTVNGHPRLLPDDLFGSCCDFDGADDFVEIKDPFDNSDAFTISIWVRPAAINDGTYHGFIGHESGGVRTSRTGEGSSWRKVRPARTSVCASFQTAGWPLTKTCGMPIGNWRGSSYVAVSAMCAGSKQTRSAYAPGRMMPRSA